MAGGRAAEGVQLGLGGLRAGGRARAGARRVAWAARGAVHAARGPPQTSTGFGTGLRMCRIVEPSAEGLKGALLP